MMLPPATESSQRSGRLLIVDDESHIRSALRRAFTETGHDVYEAATGQHALNLLKAMPFDVMVLDLRMPEMDGIELIQQAGQIRQPLSIIVLTGYASLESAITAVRSPLVIDYLQKPVRLRDLVTIVDQALIRSGIQTQTGASPSEHDSVTEESAETTSQPQTIQVNPLLLDPNRRILKSTVDLSWQCELTANEVAVLKALMAEPNRVLSCSELGYAVWHRYVAEPQAQGPIRLIVYRLRRKLRSLPAHADVIRTVRGSGYVLF